MCKLDFSVSKPRSCGFRNVEDEWLVFQDWALLAGYKTVWAEYRSVSGHRLTFIILLVIPFLPFSASFPCFGGGGRTGS